MGSTMAGDNGNGMLESVEMAQQRDILEWETAVVDKNGDPVAEGGGEYAMLDR